MKHADLDMTLAELEQAAELVYLTMPPTPQYAWPKLFKRVGAKVWVKHENHTPTGAFKVRGGLVYFDKLVRTQPAVRHVVTATRGNHGQSTSFSAHRTGLEATIYVPRGNSSDQNSAMRTFGANVVEFGKDFDEAKEEAAWIAAEQQLHWIPSVHRDLVLGVASYALELFRGAEPLDTVYVPVGMGSGICGLIIARDLLGLKTEIVGVSAVNAPASAQYFAARKPVPLPSALTFADGIATRDPNAEAIDIVCRGASRFVLVSEEEIAKAMRAYFDDTHQLAEGAGAAPLAALLQEHERMAGKTVGVIFSGGNIERARFLEVLSGATPNAV